MLDKEDRDRLILAVKDLGDIATTETPALAIQGAIRVIEAVIDNTAPEEVKPALGFASTGGRTEDARNNRPPLPTMHSEYMRRFDDLEAKLDTLTKDDLIRTTPSDTVTARLDKLERWVREDGDRLANLEKVTSDHWGIPK